MPMSSGVENALHSLVFLGTLPIGTAAGIKEIASLHNLSVSYLSKIFSKLSKAGIIRSTPGVNGGYALVRCPSEINVWEVVEAIEGSAPFFQCRAVIGTLSTLPAEGLPADTPPCYIHQVMWKAEEKMREYLRSITIAQLRDHTETRIPSESWNSATIWLTKKQ